MGMFRQRHFGAPDKGGHWQCSVTAPSTSKKPHKPSSAIRSAVTQVEWMQRFFISEAHKAGSDTEPQPSPSQQQYINQKVSVMILSRFRPVAGESTRGGMVTA